MDTDSNNKLKEGYETLWNYLIGIVSGLMGALAFYILENIIPNPKNYILLILGVFGLSLLFIFTFVIMIKIFKKYKIPEKYFMGKKSEEFKNEAVNQFNHTDEIRLRKIISNECNSALNGMVERTKKIEFMEADISRLDSFLQGAYFHDSVFCYRHGYFVASIALTAMLIERTLKIKLKEKNVDADEMKFVEVNKLCLSNGILNEKNYNNAEYIRNRRNDYFHTHMEKNLSLKNMETAYTSICWFHYSFTTSG